MEVSDNTKKTSTLISFIKINAWMKYYWVK